MENCLSSEQKRKIGCSNQHRISQLVNPFSNSEMVMLIEGFFGIPAEDQYNLEVMIEAPGFNCTLAPWNSVSPSCDEKA